MLYFLCGIPVLFLFAGKAADQIRSHVNDFGHSILVFDVDQTRSVFADDKNGARRNFSAHTASCIVLCIFCECTRSHAEGNVYQRQKNRIINVDRLTYDRLCCDKVVNSAEQCFYSILKCVVLFCNLLGLLVFEMSYGFPKILIPE